MERRTFGSRFWVLGFGFWTLTMGQRPLTIATADDASDLKALVEKFFALHARKDLDGAEPVVRFMALWSEKSPDYASRKRTMQQQFAANDYSFANLNVSRVKVDGEKATLRAAVDSTTVNMQSKQTSKQRMIRSFAFVKEGGTWKVLRDAPAADDLAAALIGARTEDERKAMLEQEKELLPELGASLHRLGHARARAGRSEEAGLAWQIWLQLSEKAGNKADIGTALIDFADLHRSQGRYADALDSYQKSLTIKEALGDRAGIASALLGTGIVHDYQGRYTEALESYQKSLAIREALGDRAGIAATLNSIGVLHREQGRYAEALAFYQKSLTMKEALGDRAGIWGTLNNIGTVHESQGRYAEALEFFQKSLTIAEALGNRAGIALTLGNIGNLHRLQGRYAEALEFIQKSLTMTEALGDRAGIALRLNNIGLVHEKQVRYAEALESYQRGLRIAEEIRYPRSIVNALNNIGNVHRLQGRYAEALENYQKSLTIAGAIGDPDTAFRCHWGMGDTYKAQGRKDDAIASYRKAIESLEQIRGGVSGGEEERLTYLHAEGKDDIYQSLAMLLVEQGKLPEALSLLERAKSKQLLDSIRLRSLTVSDESVRDLLRRTEDLEEAFAAQDRARLTELSKPDAEQDKARVANLTRVLANTRAELNQVTNAIISANPAYGKFLRPTLINLRDVQDTLPRGVAVVAYWPTETALMIFTVTRDEMKAHSVAVSSQRLDDLLTTLEKQMQRGRGSTDWDWRSQLAGPLRKTLTELYSYLIGSIQADIAKAATVLIVPQGRLHYLPFGALARASSSSTLTFFVEEKRIAVLPSLSLLNRIAKNNHDANGSSLRLAAFGNPDGTLPAAEQEAKRVAALFEGSLVYVGAQATLERVKTLPPEVNTAHFATHGGLNETDVNDCYLTLAGGAKLKLGQLYELMGKYPAKTTVLSACETASGRKDPGNEFSLLADGFGEAGSTTIIASLWKVNDESTATLMERFYKELKAGKTKAEAKRIAEIALLKNPKTAHPYYWAPFVLIGDWR